MIWVLILSGVIPHVFDIHSSLITGGRELNPILRGEDGKMVLWKAVAFKSVLLVGFFLAAYYLDFWLYLLFPISGAITLVWAVVPNYKLWRKLKK